MTRCLVVYFSQNDTTARVADRIAAGLRSAGCQPDLQRLGEEQLPDATEYDMLGIGFPVYYYRPPFNVMDYVSGLGRLQGLPAFTFMLHGTYPGNAAQLVQGELSRKGALLIGGFSCRGADLFLGYLKQGYLFSPNSPTANALRSAEAYGRECARSLESPPRPYVPKQASLGWIYRLERLVLGRWLVTNLYSRLFRVNEQCNHCGLCARLCPTGNITQDAQDKPTFGRNCLLCLTCELKCPQNAIVSPVSWPLVRPFMAHNVRAAARDPELDHVRVRHDRGKTRRL